MKQFFWLMQACVLTGRAGTHRIVWATLKKQCSKLMTGLGFLRWDWQVVIHHASVFPHLSNCNSYSFHNKLYQAHSPRGDSRSSCGWAVGDDISLAFPESQTETWSTTQAKERFGPISDPRGSVLFFLNYCEDKWWEMRYNHDDETFLWVLSQSHTHKIKRKQAFLNMFFNGQIFWHHILSLDCFNVFNLLPLYFKLNHIRKLVW